MPKLSVSIMMHPKRIKFRSYLKSKLGESVPILIDEGHGIWHTCRRAWLAFDRDAEYHAVLQDDTIVGKDFFVNAEKYLTGDYVYNFYLGRPAFRSIVASCREKKLDRMFRSNIHHEMALCIKTSRILDMIAYCDKLGPTNDKVINKYVNEKGLKVCFTLPSLVNHRWQEASLHNMNMSANNYRQALWFIGEK